MLRSALVGLMLGILAFAVSGWIIYSALWWSTGQDEIVRNSGTPGVALGGFWCLEVAVISGALIGMSTAALTTFYLQRRKQRENNIRTLL